MSLRMRKLLERPAVFTIDHDNWSNTTDVKLRSWWDVLRAYNYLKRYEKLREVHHFYYLPFVIIPDEEAKHFISRKLIYTAIEDGLVENYWNKSGADSQYP